MNNHVFESASLNFAIFAKNVFAPTYSVLLNFMSIIKCFHTYWSN